MLTSLRRQEIASLIADAEIDTTDSPEIGPPPVSQFVDEDPVKIDLPRRAMEADKEPLGLDPALSMNLEQRRKRKDTTIVVEPEQTSTRNLSTASRETERPLKAGAKRKLSVREDEEDARPIVPPSPDDFKFTRVKEEDKLKSKSSNQEKLGNKSVREVAVSRGSREKPSSTAIASRKILAPKSVNDSPRKKTNILEGKDSKVAKFDIAQEKEVKEFPREVTETTVKIEPVTNTLVCTIEMRQEPETPAGVDLFSPSSSQPSTARIESRDTPPPGDFGISTEAQRPSRRARGGVSYAEPNLRDKMRRPTKDLVDAVSKEEKAQRAALKLEEDLGPKTMTIKSEPESEDAWKAMPTASAIMQNSPLSSKAPVLLPSSITTHRKRRESFLTQTEPELPNPSSGYAVAALLAESRSARGVANEKLPANENELAKSLENLDIYDIKVSPPAPVVAPEKEIREGKPTLRFTRRHPSISRDIIVPSDNEASDMEALKKSEVSASRRRQSTLGLRNSTTNPELSKKIDPQRSLTRSTSSASMAEAGQSGNRSDRISARRRSMML